MEWISVEDRLPEDDLTVLLAMQDGKQVTGHYTCHGDFSFDDDRLKPLWYETHWMPLPEPPKEGE